MKLFCISTQQKLLLFCLVVGLFLCFSLSLPVTAHQNTQVQTSLLYTYTPVSRTTQPLDQSFTTVMLTDVSSSQYQRSSTELEDTSYTLIEFTSESTGLRLPDGTYAVLYAENQKELLPKGSTVLLHQDHTYLIPINESTAIKVDSIRSFAVENLTTNASYHQHIDTLDTYEVRIELTELQDRILYTNIDTYMVEWGDGTADTYTPETKIITHVYKKPDTYHFTVTVSDEFGYVHTLKQAYTIEYEGHLLHSYFWVKENPEPVAASSTASVSSVLIGFLALTETGKYKLLALLPLLLPMYTRISKEDVLDQFVRGQVYGYIKTNPGVHYNQIRRGIGIKNGTLSYHLRVLEKTELIKSRREGMRYRAFYPTNMSFPKNERFRLTDLQIHIIDCIKKQPGITQKEIAKRLHQKPQTINYNIKVLEQAELIQVKHKGRKTRIYNASDEDAYLNYDA